jgi:hypothetical protein
MALALPGRTQTIPQVPFLTQFTAAPISLLLADPVAAANFDLFIQDRMVRHGKALAFMLPKCTHGHP